MTPPVKSALGFLTLPGIILVLAIILFFVVRATGHETRAFDGYLFAGVLVLWILCFVLGRNKQ